MLIIDKGNLSLKQYEETEPPYQLPDNLDVFSWSVPFLAEKVANMLYNIVKKGGGDEEAEPTPVMPNPFSKPKPGMDGDKYAAIKGKISSVGRMSKMFKTLREQSEMLLMIK